MTQKVHRSSDRYINWMFPVQGMSPPGQVKEPYGNLDMLLEGFYPAAWSVQSTPADSHFVSLVGLTTFYHRYSLF